MKSPVETVVAASPALLSAALGGLLLMAPACGSSDSTGSGSGNGDGTSTSSTSDGGNATTTQASGDTPIPDTGCDAGVVANPTVTSRTVGAVTKDQFTAECAAKNGIFETQPHCGGSNAGRGFSYDSDTQTLTEHTCRATNSCAGYSCVVCD